MKFAMPMSIMLLITLPGSLAISQDPAAEATPADVPIATIRTGISTIVPESKMAIFAFSDSCGRGSSVDLKEKLPADPDSLQSEQTKNLLILKMDKEVLVFNAVDAKWRRLDVEGPYEVRIEHEIVYVKDNNAAHIFSSNSADWISVQLDSAKIVEKRGEATIETAKLQPPDQPATLRDTKERVTGYDFAQEEREILEPHLENQLPVSPSSSSLEKLQRKPGGNVIAFLPDDKSRVYAYSVVKGTGRKIELPPIVDGVSVQTSRSIALCRANDQIFAFSASRASWFSLDVKDPPVNVRLVDDVAYVEYENKIYFFSDMYPGWNGVGIETGYPSHFEERVSQPLQPPMSHSQMNPALPYATPPQVSSLPQHAVPFHVNPALSRETPHSVPPTSPVAPNLSNPTTGMPVGAMHSYEGNYMSWEIVAKYASAKGITLDEAHRELLKAASED